MSEKPEILFATLAAEHFPDQYETPIREIMVDYGFRPFGHLHLPGHVGR